MPKFVSIFLIASIYIGCANSSKSQANQGEVDGKKIYKINCTLCHGSNGKLGANGSKDLTMSKFTLEERVSLITNGKGAMAPYKGILSPEEIEAVAAYTMTLK